MKKVLRIVAAATVASIAVEISALAAAENSQKLSGVQIRAKFTGRQLTHEVHWRYVYDRDGKLRSYSMGATKVGNWAVERRTSFVFISRSRTMVVTRYLSRAKALR
jgi:hypothetical protein